MKYQLRRRYASAIVQHLMLAIGLIGVLSSAVVARTSMTSISSSRDVDLAFFDSTLVALAWHEGAWQSLRVDELGRVESTCVFSGRAWFSYDKRAVLSMITHPSPRLLIHDPVRCSEHAAIALDVRARDADVHLKARRVAAARRTSHGLELSLYALDGTWLAHLGSIENAELGFSNDGSALFNFDHGGGQLRFWSASTGTPQSLSFLDRVDLHFSGDGQQAFITQPGSLMRFDWPADEGTAQEPIPVSPNEVLRGSSRHGNTVVLQQPQLSKPSMPSVRLYDRVRNRSIVLGAGHIDAVALDERGHQFAIAIRDPRRNVVRIRYTRERQAFTP